MKVQAKGSPYQEDELARTKFTEPELRHLRFLLRRLRFLDESKDRYGGPGKPDKSGGSVFAEAETRALAWALTEIGFLKE